MPKQQCEAALPSYGGRGKWVLSEFGERIIQRRNLISFLSTMMSEYGERGKAKKKFKFFLIYYAVWIWWEEKQKRKLLSFSTIFNECCLNMGRRKSKEEICIISYLLWYLNMVRGKKEICILSFLAFSGYADPWYVPWRRRSNEHKIVILLISF